jgi:hypothetical protein
MGINRTSQLSCSTTSFHRLFVLRSVFISYLGVSRKPRRLTESVSKAPTG